MALPEGCGAFGDGGGMAEDGDVVGCYVELDEFGFDGSEHGG